MQASLFNAETIVADAASAAIAGDDHLSEKLDAFPVAIYITDAEGLITHFNRACIAFAGREPTALHDRWCVTWKLYTREGVGLPHAECPMAVAIHERRKVRGVSAVAERPDGSRVTFVPYPTPLFDRAGAFIGAINLLLDVTDPSHAELLRDQAIRCRRLAAATTDSATARILLTMGTEYEEQARALACLY